MEFSCSLNAYQRTHINICKRMAPLTLTAAEKLLHDIHKTYTAILRLLFKTTVYILLCCTI